MQWLAFASRMSASGHQRKSSRGHGNVCCWGLSRRTGNMALTSDSSQKRTLLCQGIYAFSAVTICASIGMTISPEGWTNSASVLSDSTARAAISSSPRLSAKREPLTSIRTNSFPEPQSGQGAVERGNVSQTRRMTNLRPRNRVRYRKRCRYQLRSHRRSRRRPLRCHGSHPACSRRRRRRHR